jgi:hypothetical protein
VHPDEADDLEIDEANEEHLVQHHVTALEVFQVWQNGPVYAPNKRGLTAAWLMLGDTDGGRSLTIAVLVKERSGGCVRSRDGIALQGS